MASINKVILIGNLGTNPESRNMQDGRKVVSFSFATNENWKDKKTGESKQKTEWHKVIIFNEKIANMALDYLKKGSKAYIEGQLQTRKWNDTKGIEHYITEIVLSNFNGSLVLLDAKNNNTSHFDDL